MLKTKRHSVGFTFGNNGIYTSECVVPHFQLPKIDFGKINGFRNSKYFGLSYQSYFVLFNQKDYNSQTIELDDTIHSLDSSPDENFVVVLTKNKRLYVICLSTGKSILRKEINEIDFIKGTKIIILPITNNVCDIWLFVGTAILKFRDINFEALSDAILLNDDVKKNNLLGCIKVEKMNVSSKVFNSSYLNSVSWRMAKYIDRNNYLVAAIFDKSLMVVTSHVHNGHFMTDYIYSTEFSEISFDIGVKSVEIELSSDASNVIILDGMGKIWTFNFVVGCLSGILSQDYQNHCRQIALSHIRPDEKNHDEEKDVLIEFTDNLLSFRDLKSMTTIENFNFKSQFYYFPSFSDNETIFILDNCDPNNNLARILKIKRLNPYHRLEELISSKLYSEAKKFAEKFDLDPENIYFNELKDTVEAYTATHKNDEIIVKSFEQIKKTFDAELYRKLLMLNMCTFELQEKLLSIFYRFITQLKQAPELDDFKILLDKHIFQWELFKDLFSILEYTSNVWSQFQNLSYIDLVFFVLQNPQIIFKKFNFIWPKIRDQLGDLFTLKLEFLKRFLLQRCNYLLSSHQPTQIIINELDDLFSWICVSLVDAHIDNNPEELKGFTDFILEMMVKIEHHMGRDSHQILKKIQLVEERLWKIREDMKNSDLSWCYSYSNARLNSDLEHCNPSIAIDSFLKDIALIDKLYTNYNLDFNLEVIRSESGLELVTRIMNQTMLSDITDSFIKNKLRNFLMEFNIREEDFFLHYVCQLVNQVKVSTKKSDDERGSTTIIGEYSTILKKFLLLFMYIRNKQQRLEALNEFVSHSDCPFPTILYDAIEKEITDCSPHNPAANNLTRLLKLSRLTPILQKYNLPSNLNNYPTHVIIVAVLKFQNSSLSDLNQIIQELNISKQDLWSAKTDFYLERILYCGNEEIDQVLLNSFDQLKNVLLKEIVCLEERRKIVKTLLNTIDLSMEIIIDLWDYTKRTYVMNVYSWLIDLLEDKLFEQAHYKVYTSLKLYNTSDIELIGANLQENLLQQINDKLYELFLVQDRDESGTITDKHIANQPINVLTKILVKSIVEFRDDYLNEKGSVIDHDIFLFHCQSALLVLINAISIKENEFGNRKNRIKCLFMLTQGQFEVFVELCCAKLRMVSKIRESLIYRSLKIIINHLPINQYFYEYFSLLKSLRYFYTLYPFADSKYMARIFNYKMNILSTSISLLESFARYHTPGKFPQISQRPKNHKEIPTRNTSANSVDHIARLTLSIFFSVKRSKSLSTNQSVLAESTLNANITMSTLSYPDNEVSMMKRYFDLVLEKADKLHQDGLTIIGCTSLIDNCVQILSNFNMNDRYYFLSKYPELTGSLVTLFTQHRDKHLVSYWKALVKKSICDQSLACALSLVAPIDSIIHEIRTFFKFCSKPKRLLTICSISTYLLIVHNIHHGEGAIIMEKRLELLKHVLRLTRFWIWSDELMDRFKIKLPSLSSSDGGDTNKEIGHLMMRHFDMNCQTIYDYYNDFNIFKPSVMIEFFQQMFLTDFGDCRDIYEYKEKARQLLLRADEVWNKIQELHPSFNDTNRIYYVISSISPYHYEILEFIYKILNSISNEYNTELKILNLLSQTTRTSQVSDAEIKFSENHSLDKHLNPSKCYFLSSVRLPFHMLISSEAIQLIIPELDMSTVHLWVKMYSLLDELCEIHKATVNEDILRENTARNIIKSFFKDYPRHEDSPGRKEVVFLGDSYKKSADWFEGVVNNVMLVMLEMASNQSIVDVLEEFIKGINAAEQLTYLITVTNKWSEKKLQDAYCNNRCALETFYNENDRLIKNIRLNNIVYKHGLYFEHDIMNDEPLRTMSAIICFEYKYKAPVIAILKEISSTFNIDLDDFCFNTLKSKFTMQDAELDGSCADYNESFCNMSYVGNDSFEEVVKPSIDTNLQHFIEVQILSYDQELKRNLLFNLLSYVEKTPMSLSQWSFVLEYLRLVWLPRENEQVEQLASNSMYAAFQLYRTLLPRFHSLTSSSSSSTNTAHWTLAQYRTNISEFRVMPKTQFLVSLCSISSNQQGLLGCPSNQQDSPVQHNYSNNTDTKMSSRLSRQYELPNSSNESMRLLKSIVFVLTKEAVLNGTSTDLKTMLPDLPEELAEILKKLQ